MPLYTTVGAQVRYLTIRTFVGGAGAVPADRLTVNVVFDDGVVNV